MSGSRASDGNRDEVLIQAWTSHLEAMGAAAGTIRLYRNTLRRLAAIVGPLPAVSLKDLEGHLWQEGGSARTVNNRIAAFRSFYDHLVRLKVIPDNPARRLERRPQEETFPTPIDNPEEAFEHLDPESRAMAIFILETGVEVSEALSINVNPPVPEEITVRGRAGKERNVFLTPQARKALDDIGGRIKIGARALQRRFDRFGFSPRQLRQTLASQLRDSDVDPWTIQQILGHKIPQAAKPYATYSPGAQRAAHEKRRARLARRAEAERQGRARSAEAPSGKDRSGKTTENVRMTDAWFEGIYIEEAQRELLSWMVEGERTLSAEKHDRFLLVSTFEGTFLIHPHLSERPSVRKGDLETLADHALLRRDFGGRGTPLYEITPLGRRYYSEMKRRGHEAPDSVEDEMRRFLDTDAFAATFPDALRRWRDAERDLWSAETIGQFTEIGHICREAMQAFASALAEQHRVEDVPSDPEKTVDRLRAVLAKAGPTGGHVAYLDGLLAYWGVISDFIQRQEHGAGKEREPLTWEDARRTVFQTLVVMFEIARALR